MFMFFKSSSKITGVSDINFLSFYILNDIDEKHRIMCSVVSA